MGVLDEKYAFEIRRYDKIRAFYSILYNELAKMYGKVSVPSYICNNASDNDVRIFYTYENNDYPDKGTLANIFKARVADKYSLYDDAMYGIDTDENKNEESIENMFSSKFKSKECSSLEGLNFCLKVLYENGKVSYSSAQGLLRDITNICALDYIIGADKRSLSNIPISIDVKNKDAKIIPFINDNELFTYNIGIIPISKRNTSTKYLDTLLRLKNHVNIFEFEENFDNAIKFYYDNLDSTVLFNAIVSLQETNNIKISQELVEYIMENFIEKREDIKLYIRAEK